MTVLDYGRTLCSQQRDNHLTGSNGRRAGRRDARVTRRCCTYAAVVDLRVNRSRRRAHSPSGGPAVASTTSDRNCGSVTSSLTAESERALIRRGLCSPAITRVDDRSDCCVVHLEFSPLIDFPRFVRVMTSKAILSGQPAVSAHDYAPDLALPSVARVDPVPPGYLPNTSRMSDLEAASSTCVSAPRRNSRSATRSATTYNPRRKRLTGLLTVRPLAVVCPNPPRGKGRIRTQSVRVCGTDHGRGSGTGLLGCVHPACRCDRPLLDGELDPRGRRGNLRPVVVMCVSLDQFDAVLAPLGSCIGVCRAKQRLARRKWRLNAGGMRGVGEVRLRPQSGPRTRGCPWPPAT